MNNPNIPDQCAVEQKRSEIIARRAQRKLYDREKTIALATGVICALIFLGGTALGSYHAFVMIGPFAGVLATASYLIADAVIIWAAVVDYHEDKNPMEWMAWAVKYGLSLYMLLAGGCIAYKLFTLNEAKTAITQRTGAATKAYNDCVAAARTNRQRAACRQFAGDVQATEATAHASRTNAARPAWMDRFTNHPLFNYLPGLLAVLGAALLTLISKLFPQRLDDDLIETAPRTTQNAPRTLAGFAPAPAQASIPRPRRYVRVAAKHDAAPLDAFAEKLAHLGAVDPADLPTNPPAHTVNKAAPEGEINPPTNPPTDHPEAGGWPVLPDIHWEHKRDGAVEAWYAPEGGRNRARKVYIGRLGKRQLAAWQQLAPAEFRRMVCEWIEHKRVAKQIN